MFMGNPADSFNPQNDAASVNLSAVGDDPVNSSNGTALGVGAVPLLTAPPCLPAQNMEDDQDFLNIGRNNGIQFWQNHTQYNNDNNIKKTTASILDHNPYSLFPATGIGCGIFRNSITASSRTITCEDCGNQSKKDCSYRRCRTCCNSRGYDCPTHVTSTWIPAARRRQRELMTVAGGGGGSGAACSSGSTSAVKRPRLLNTPTTNSHDRTSNSPRSFETSSSNQGFDANFKVGLPTQVRAKAVFRCVTVTAVDDGEDEYAYQAVVKIGGRVYKGCLYDQGVEAMERESFPNISELQLGGGDGLRNGAAASSPIIDPTSIYAASGGGGLFAATTGYGNPMN